MAIYSCMFQMNLNDKYKNYGVGHTSSSFKEIRLSHKLLLAGCCPADVFACVGFSLLVWCAAAFDTSDFRYFEARAGPDMKREPAG